MEYHSHINNKTITDIKNNTLYVARKNLSLNQELPGAGVFKFDDSLVLTKERYTRSRWKLPPEFKSVKISYHPDPWKKNLATGEEYFQSATIGQEFVIGGDKAEDENTEENQAIINWAKNKIEK